MRAGRETRLERSLRVRMAARLRNAHETPLVPTPLHQKLARLFPNP
jgi:hypothetical protein